MLPPMFPTEADWAEWQRRSARQKRTGRLTGPNPKRIAQARAKQARKITKRSSK